MLILNNDAQLAILEDYVWTSSLRVVLNCQYTGDFIESIKNRSQLYIDRDDMRIKLIVQREYNAEGMEINVTDTPIYEKLLQCAERPNDPRWIQTAPAGGLTGAQITELADNLEALADKIEQPQVESPAGIDATLAARGARYGKFTNHADYCQRMKAVLYSRPNYSDLPPDIRESLEMIVHKIGRILNGDPEYDDSWRDIAGYATLVEKRINGETI